ncbi:hypothetical protein ACE04B_33120, partial [Rhizobium phaseoli]
ENRSHFRHHALADSHIDFRKESCTIQGVRQSVSTGCVSLHTIVFQAITDTSHITILLKLLSQDKHDTSQSG